MSKDNQNPDFRLVLLLALLALAAAARIFISAHGMPTLITKTLSDDAFYYFQVARNVATGGGVSFDGVEPTNGFHPLWLALLLPIYLVAGNRTAAPVHAALVLESLLDVGAGFFIYLTVRTLTRNRSAAIIGAAAYLLNPSVIFHAVNGLETGLNLFCFSFYFWFYLRMVSANQLTTRNMLLFGLVSGALLLARTDNAVVVGVVYLHLLVFRQMYRRPLTITASAAMCALVVAPWVVWNLLTFGSLAQSSGHAYGIVARGNLRASGVTDSRIFLTSLANTATLFIWTIPSDVFGWGKLMGIVAGMAAGMLLVDESRTRPIWSAARVACVPLLAFIALALTHSLVRGTLKSWYFMPAAALGALFLGIFCGPYDYSKLMRAPRARIVIGVLAAVILSGYALNGWKGWRKGMYPWQSEQLMAAEWVSKHVNDDQWIGSFNAGIIGYVSGKRVVNLDGLVNNSVVPYLEQRRLWDYIRERDISYLVDSDYSILKDYRDFYGEGWMLHDHLARVAAIDDPRVSWAGANVGVYRVKK